LWTKRNDESSGTDLERYLVAHLSGEAPLNVFPTFLKVVKWLPNWKAAGHDGIFNFFIKKFESLHQHLYEAVIKICLENHTEEE
jgi:hypothetical protein